MQSGRKTRLRNMLDVATKQGVQIYLGGEKASPEDIFTVQCVFENFNYVPEFIVKDSTGEIKEIWYSEPKKNCADG